MRFDKMRQAMDRIKSGYYDQPEVIQKVVDDLWQSGTMQTGSAITSGSDCATEAARSSTTQDNRPFSQESP
jgi:hypothetical protein